MPEPITLLLLAGSAYAARKFGKKAASVPAWAPLAAGPVGSGQHLRWVAVTPSQAPAVAALPTVQTADAFIGKMVRLSRQNPADAATFRRMAEDVNQAQATYPGSVVLVVDVN